MILKYLLHRVSSLVGSTGLTGGRRATNHSAQFRVPSGRPKMPSAVFIALIAYVFMQAVSSAAPIRRTRRMDSL